MSASLDQVDPEAGHQDPAAVAQDNNGQPTIDETKINCIYFGYGSNLSPRSMKQRCPDSLFAGLARLPGWKWMINETGYANIIPSTDDDEVYGSLCFLSSRDEAALDESEGVPWLYEKKMLKVQRVPNPGATTNPEVPPQEVEAIAYVDFQRTTEGQIEKEYVVWIRKAIEDGLKCGMPMTYADKYLKKYLPDTSDPIRQVMMVRTARFGDKNAGLVPKGFASWSRG